MVSSFSPIEVCGVSCRDQTGGGVLDRQRSDTPDSLAAMSNPTEIWPNATGAAPNPAAAAATLDPLQMLDPEQLAELERMSDADISNRIKMLENDIKVSGSQRHR